LNREKMTMKKTSLILLIAVFCGCIGTFGFAAEEEKNFANEEFIISYLLPQGIGGEETVSRKEFIRVLVSLVYGEQPNHATGFSDIPESDAASGAVWMAEQTGIIDRNTDAFYPDLPIRYEHAMKIAVNALGYGIRAEATGGYPYGYSMIGQSLRLFEKMERTDGFMSPADVRLFLFNVISAPLYETKQIGESVTYDADKDKTTLTERYNIYTVEGIEYANELTGLTSADVHTRENYINIEGTDYAYDCDKDYIGYRIRGYYHKKDDQKTLLCMIPYRTVCVSLKTDQISKLSQTKLTYENEQKKETYTIFAGYSLIYNGKAYEGEQADSLLLSSEGELALIDSNQDNAYETIYLENINYLYVKSVNDFDNIVYGTLPTDQPLNFGQQDRVYHLKKKTGGTTENCGLHDIKSGDVIAYTVSEDGLYYNAVIINEEVSGTITSINYEEKCLTLDGASYIYNEYFETYFLEAIIGSKGRFLLDECGRICVLAENTDDLQYGWIVRTEQLDDIRSDIQINIFTQKGTMEILSLAECVNTDGESIKKDILKTRLDNLTDSARFVRYGLNTDSELNKIDFAETADGKTPYFDKKPQNNSLTIYHQKESLQYQQNGKLFAPKFYAGNSMIFIIPDSEEKRLDDDAYSVVDAGFLVNDRVYKASAYDVDADGNARAVLLFADDLKWSLQTESATGIVERVTNSVNEDGEQIYNIYMSGNGVYFMLQSVCDHTNETASLLQPGDLIRFERNSQNQLIAVNREYDLKNNKVLAAKSEVVKYIQGYIYGYQNGMMQILPGESIPEEFSYSDLLLARVGGAKITYVYVNVNEAGDILHVSVRMQPDNVIESYINAGNRADRVIARQRYYMPNQTWVYKFVR